MNKESKIYVAGHDGMAGTALMRRLASDGYTNIVTRLYPELDLTRQTDVETFFAEEKPEYVFLLAARVGGIVDNRDHPADALITNSLIELNVIKSAFENGVKKLIFTASSTVYPEISPQPMGEDLLLTGAFEFFWGGYALAKALGIKLCEYLGRQYGAKFTAVVLPNLYGSGDKGSTVLPMLVSKFHNAVTSKAKHVEVWGTGNARREFLHADELAGALLFLAEKHEGGGHINVGYGTDITIRELAELIKKISGFKGEILFDTTKPDGTSRKLLDSSRMFELGWKPKISLEQGIRAVYEEYGKNHDDQSGENQK